MCVIDGQRKGGISERDVAQVHELAFCFVLVYFVNSTRQLNAALRVCLLFPGSLTKKRLAARFCFGLFNILFCNDDE